MNNQQKSDKELAVEILIAILRNSKMTISHPETPNTLMNLYDKILGRLKDPGQQDKS